MVQPIKKLDQEIREGEKFFFEKNKTIKEKIREKNNFYFRECECLSFFLSCVLLGKRIGMSLNQVFYSFFHLMILFEAKTPFINQTEVVTSTVTTTVATTTPVMTSQFIHSETGIFLWYQDGTS